MTIVAAGLTDTDLARPGPSGSDSAASLARQIRKRRWGLALVAVIAAIPTGLVVLWAPNDTWGSLPDGVAVFFWGAGLHALTAMLDARRLGWTLARKASPVPQPERNRRAVSVAPSRDVRADREPASQQP